LGKAIMPNLYIISGCNGAGKTTASFSVLPEMLQCEDFINADEIARGLSPFNPDKAAIEAGRIMLSKIDKLIGMHLDFAFETTLATKSYVKTIEKAKKAGYRVFLLYFWLDSVELAIERVANRVKDGGHNIPENVIRRRYFSGIQNLFKLYIPVCDNWLMMDNSRAGLEIIAEGELSKNKEIKNIRIFDLIKNLAL
jgi:predicted ABC-type ATPase